jgi:hypothetical protein
MSGTLLRQPGADRGTSELAEGDDVRAPATELVGYQLDAATTTDADIPRDEAYVVGHRETRAA